MKNVISNAVLPVYTSAGKRYTEIDNIIVLPTCVAVIEIKSMIGRIENPEGAQTWRQNAVTRSGEIKELDFRNRYHLTILGTKSGADIQPILHADYIFEKDSHIMVVGHTNDIQRVIRH